MVCAINNREQTYFAILEKAHELFRRYGFRKVAVADIAHELRMSPANVYKFFPSKKAIIEAVGGLMMIDLRRQLLPVITAQKPALTRIKDVIRAVNSYFLELVNSKKLLESDDTFRSFVEFETLKRLEKWQFVGRFLRFALHEMILGLLEEGLKNEELEIDDTDVLALALIECVASSVEPLILIGVSPSEADERLERQFWLIARSITRNKII